MIKTILVPLDGSPLAEMALPYAKAIAKRTGANLVLVRAAQNRSPLGDATYDALQHTIEQSTDYLQNISDDLTAQGFAIQIGVPYGGSAAEWIAEEVEMRHADLVVMATHDRVGPDRWVHGSVAEGVVHRAAVPVALIRSGGAADAFEAPEQQPVVVVPLDGSELAEAALPVAREFASVFGARVVLVGVVPRQGQLVAGYGGAVVTYVGDDYAKLEAEARGYLEMSVPKAGANAQYVVRFGDPASEIASAAQEYAAAAVIMATHGRTGAVRLVLGSVAGGVLHHSEMPIVLIRPRRLRGAEDPAVAPQVAAAAAP